MKRIGLVLFFILWTLDCGLLTISYAQEEQITLTTYYPAPYGVYRQLASVGIGGVPPLTTPVWWPLEGSTGAESTLVLMNIGVPTNDVTAGNITVPALLQVGGICEMPSGSPPPSTIHRAAIVGKADIGVVGEGTDIGVKGSLNLKTDSTCIITPTADKFYAYEPKFYAINAYVDNKSNKPISIAGVYGKVKKTESLTIPEQHYYGIYGESQINDDETGSAYGVYGKATGTWNAGFNDVCGIYGESNCFALYAKGDNYGVWSTATDDDNNGIATGGYFKGNLGIHAETTKENGFWAGEFVGNVNSTGGYYENSTKITAASYWTLSETNLYNNNSGNVGIGEPIPTAKLHVNGNIKAVLNNTLGQNWMQYNKTTNEIGWYGTDIAELFNTDEEVEPGDVLIIDENKKLKKSDKLNDTKVAGIVSSAPAILFEGSELQIAPEPFKFEKGTKPPVTLAGRVLCKVDASYGEINPGDLLTTSPTPGHAMKTKPIGEINGYPIYPQGCIVGKALEGLKEGKGKILVLVCLM